MKYEDDKEQDLEVYRTSWDHFIDAYSDALKQIDPDLQRKYDELLAYTDAMSSRLEKSKIKIDQTLVEEYETWRKSQAQPA